MINYKKILFPVDIHQKSFKKIVPHVKAMADRFEAKVHIVYVAKASEYYLGEAYTPGETKYESGQIITQTVKEFIQMHCAELTEPKVVVLDGKEGPDIELLAYIEEAGIDLVIMATQGRSALGKAIFGSVAGSLVRSAPVPVFLVRPDASVE